MIYDSNGVALQADQIADAVRDWPQLYSDDGQATPATRANLLSELDDARTASAATVQAMIDADEKLSALAEPPVASADAVDHEWVVVTLPTDSGTPLFWAGQAALIVEGSGQFVEQRVDVLDDNGDPTGEKTGAWKVRMGKGRWRVELARISDLL